MRAQSTRCAQRRGPRRWRGPRAQPRPSASRRDAHCPPAGDARYASKREGSSRCHRMNPSAHRRTREIRGTPCPLPPQARRRPVRVVLGAAGGVPGALRRAAAGRGRARLAVADRTGSGREADRVGRVPPAPSVVAPRIVPRHGAGGSGRGRRGLRRGGAGPGDPRVRAAAALGAAVDGAAGRGGALRAARGPARVARAPDASGPGGRARGPARTDRGRG